MQDIFQEKAKCWNLRLKALMDAKGYRQERFAEDLNKKYGTQYGQKIISRWLHIGEKTSDGMNGFPKYETMINIADFFGVDVGYLTGETDCITFTLNDACAYLGLTAESINAIRSETRPEINLPNLEITRTSLSMLLSAGGFIDVIDSISRAYTASKEYKKKFKNVIDADNELQKIEYVGKMERYDINESMMLLINELFPKQP